MGICCAPKDAVLGFEHVRIGCRNAVTVTRRGGKEKEVRFAFCAVVLPWEVASVCVSPPPIVEIGGRVRISCRRVARPVCWCFGVFRGRAWRHRHLMHGLSSKCSQWRKWESGRVEVSPKPPAPIHLHADDIVQSSQIVSKSRSALLSPPQMLHRFLSLPEPPSLPNPKPLGTSKLRLLGPSSSSSLSAISFRRCDSSSTASYSRSGASSIVSRELMEGEREREEDGVEEIELKELLLA
jgi:hypothetical protein